ncbi:hypothetical protein [Candidatus Uabimicrobium sp. HlEnr_7]|uniref:hypothetical protein n=1 Tax=Candidatus Uabimicrobium helgolandensis TaxID=3095367 RepID=UPI0035569C70
MRMIFFLTLVFSIVCNAQSNIEIQLDITHDVLPPKDLPPYTVSITNKTLTKQLQSKNTIAAGIYDITISQPGYKTQVIKQQPITSSPFVIKTTLIAKKRQISFEMVAYSYSNVSPQKIFNVQNNKQIAFSVVRPQALFLCSCLVDAHSVMNVKTNAQVKFRDTFQPGKQVHFIIQFAKYKTTEFIGVIPPGEGPYIIPVKLKRLTPLEFTIRKNTQIIDGVAYEYQFTTDGKRFEDHHIKVEKGIGRFYYTIMINPDAKNFRAFIGHSFSERSMKKFRSGMSIGRPECLSVPLFIDHCNKFKKEEAIGIINKFLKGFRHRKMLKNCSEQELKQLINYSQTLSPNLEQKIRNVTQNSKNINKK